jgi:hypothetical protein
MHDDATDPAIPVGLPRGIAVHVPGVWPVDTGQSGAHRT